MTYDLFLALLGFAFVTSVTPGPNNMMLLASGVNRLRRTVPHMLGMCFGHALMVFLVGLGLAGVFQGLAPGAPGAQDRLGRLYVVAGLEDRPFRRAGRGAGQGHADDLPAGGGVPVGEPEGLGNGAGRGLGLCGGAFALGLCGGGRGVRAGQPALGVVWAGAGQAVALVAGRDRGACAPSTG